MSQSDSWFHPDKTFHGFWGVGLSCCQIFRQKVVLNLVRWADGFGLVMLPTHAWPRDCVHVRPLSGGKKQLPSGYLT